MAGLDRYAALGAILLVSPVLGMRLPVTAAIFVLATISATSLTDLIITSTMVAALTGGNVPDTATMMLSLVYPGMGERVAAGLTEAEAHALLASPPVEICAALRPELLVPSLMADSLLAAHIFIFWVSQDSDMAPPVCLPAFVAAAIAKSPPMAAGIAALRMCKGLYVIPLPFASTPLTSGDWSQMLIVFVPAVGLHARSAAKSGVLYCRLGLAGRPAAARSTLKAQTISNSTGSRNAASAAGPIPGAGRRTAGSRPPQPPLRPRSRPAAPLPR